MIMSEPEAIASAAGCALAAVLIALWYITSAPEIQLYALRQYQHAERDR